MIFIIYFIPLAFESRTDMVHLLSHVDERVHGNHGIVYNIMFVV